MIMSEYSYYLKSVERFANSTDSGANSTDSGVLLKLQIGTANMQIGIIF
jgi:hypothetical protein